ncbi:PepSY-associated TM helix domain-containing protein [Sphingomonas nostoxanthinifaciens]|uniref:PepSY-associated TM helix domain-containing protein n=1 Tax=Sphingomonas nostoxanthinifaciens TaxID=2872652 RepID=UPI001CC1DEC5|nr:PepSY-associated TM helix domain-containing protein [Sphingomonas nostoxanthinifaciens]UAK26576.1 PepSY-associated TM helix domain-containing protein [Sphingomonas nostoxanthinifaciens]
MIPSHPQTHRRSWRSWWLKQLHTWHWVSAAISLLSMLLFAVTGITLNHAASIDAKPVVKDSSGTLPGPLRPLLASPPRADAPLPTAVAKAVRDIVGVDAGSHAGEWSDGEVYVALPRPGGDAWVSIDRANGHISAETTDRGWISYLNDLHKGRNAGAIWFWFIDLFAAACVLFTITGLLLLQFHARRRPMTWPMVAAGVALPIIVAILFIH